MISEVGPTFCTNARGCFDVIPIAVTAATDGTTFLIPLVWWLPPVAGHPFSAEETSQLNLTGAKTPGPTKVYRLYRDGQGRTLSVPARGGRFNPDVMEIVDPVAGYWYVLDAARKVVHRSRIPVRAPHAANPDAVSLGSQYFLGVQAEGKRVTTPGGIIAEDWISHDMQLPVILRTYDKIGTASVPITSLQLEEPASGLFRIPEDYTLVDETGAFVVK